MSESGVVVGRGEARLEHGVLPGEVGGSVGFCVLRSQSIIHVLEVLQV